MSQHMSSRGRGRGQFVNHGENSQGLPYCSQERPYRDDGHGHHDEGGSQRRRDNSQDRPQRDGRDRSHGGGGYQEDRKRSQERYRVNSRERQYDNSQYYNQSHQSLGSGPQYNNYDNNGGYFHSPPQNHNRWDRQNSSSEKKRNRRDENPEMHLSKTLSFLLRHGAERQGFKLMQGGFLYIDEILGKINSLHGFQIDDVMNVVENNDKKRFFVKKSEDGRLMIRANQGHTIEVDDLELTPVTSAEEFPLVIHGTYWKSWEMIKTSGLSRMGRNHIHFAAGEPGENGVISGMRTSCEVMIFIDMEKALKDNLQFFRSANNVILSPGDSNGFIYPTYFKTVMQRYPRHLITFDNTKCTGGDKPVSHSDKQVSHKKKHKKKRDRESDAHDTAENKESRLKSPTEPTPTGFDLVDQDESMRDMFEDKGATCSTVGQEPPKGDKDDDALIEAEYDILDIRDTPDCLKYVEKMMRSESPMALSCYGDELGQDDAKIEKIVCAKDKKVYVFHVCNDKDFMCKGKLEALLLEKKPVKIIHGGAAMSKTLFDQFRIILDGTDIFDTKVICKYVQESNMGNLEELVTAGFSPEKLENKNAKDFNNGNQDEEKEKAKSLVNAYKILSGWLEDDKEYKKEVYKELNFLIPPEKLKSAKAEKKKQEKAQKSDAVNQKQQGKKNKKKK